MKIKLFTVLFLFFIFCHAQDKNKTYKISYKAAYIGNADSNIVLTDENEKQKREIQNKYIENYSNIDLELVFNSELSLFYSKDNLKSDSNMYYELALKKITGGKVFYKNIELREKQFFTSIFGDSFGVNVPYDEFTWDIVNETKEINNLKCYKATTTKIIPSSVYNEERKMNIEVWFTNEILGSYGPCGIDGLPGVVLSVTYNNIHIYATKIEMDQDLEIKIPKSKIIFKSEEEFNKEIFKKFEEFKKNN